jgi:ribosomal protein L3
MSGKHHVCSHARTGFAGQMKRIGEAMHVTSVVRDHRRCGSIDPCWMRARGAGFLRALRRGGTAGVLRLHAFTEETHIMTPPILPHAIHILLK